MTNLGHCPHCSRAYRSEAQKQLAENRRAILDDLKATCLPHPDLSRHDRHQSRSEAFRATGDLQH